MEENKQMNLRTSLETYTILSLLLKSYTPLLAIICSNRPKEIRSEAFMKLADELNKSESDKEMVIQLIQNLTGKTVDFSGSPSEIMTLLVQGWKQNNVDECFIALKQFGIIDDKDIANYAWILANWRTPQ